MSEVVREAVAEFRRIAALKSQLMNAVYEEIGLGPVLEIDATGYLPGAASFWAVFTFSEPVSGFDSYDVLVTNGVVTDPNGQSGQTLRQFSFNITPDPSYEGTFFISVPSGAALNAQGLLSSGAHRYLQIVTPTS